MALPFSYILFDCDSSVGSFRRRFSQPEKSPQVVGTLMSGLFLGILLARSIAGLLSTVWSWHAVYLISGVVILVFAWVMLRVSHQLNIYRFMVHYFH